MALPQNPTRATLLPVVGESVDFEAAQHVFIEGDNLNNPDWAIVMDNPEEEEGKPILYLVRETKGTGRLSDLRPQERRKILCGKRHFEGALGVSYRVVTSASELP